MPLTVSAYIKQQLGNIPDGEVFDYNQFLRESSETEAVIKALNRMVKAGKLAKLSRGRYYKPEETVFGTLQPAQGEVVKDILWQDDQPVGYLTGLSIYNRLGLTTQISNTIQVGKNDIRPSFRRGKYKISFIRQKNPINEANIPLLQILDAIRYIKKIPDTSIRAACKRLQYILQDLETKEIGKMIDLAQKYPPSTRALLGALLEANEISPDLLSNLKRSLNPITSYKLMGKQNFLNTAKNWNIT